MPNANTKEFEQLTQTGHKRMLRTDETDGLVTGFFVSEVAVFTIPDGQTGSAVAIANLAANYKVLGIVCLDASGIQATTNLTAEVAYDTNTQLATLYEQDDPGTQWSAGSLPTSGDFAFILTHGFGVRRIRLILSQVSSGAAVPFLIYGFHGGS